MKKRILLFGALCTVLLFTSFTHIPKQPKIVVIDFGHGGKDKGAQDDEISENQILLELQEEIRKESRTITTQIVFLRKKDKFMTLEKRVKKINDLKPNLLISLHLSFSENPEDNGITGYVSKENPFYEESHKNAIRLTYNLSHKVLNNQGVKDADLFLLTNSNCPALTLELGYLTNKRDKEYLTSQSGQFELAQIICQMVR
ncbi:MAG: N-acetylmuramoyl-L-alanine amidase family protein [Bacteroidota bacterium]